MHGRDDLHGCTRTDFSARSTTASIAMQFPTALRVQAVDVLWVQVPPVTNADEVLYIQETLAGELSQQGALSGGFGSNPIRLFLALPKPTPAAYTIYPGGSYDMLRRFDDATLSNINLSLIKADGTPLVLASGEWALGLAVYSR